MDSKPIWILFKQSVVYIVIFRSIMSLQFADLIRGRTRLKMSKEKFPISIDKKQINSKIQKWP